MALNGNDLGDLVYAVRQTYSNKTVTQLVADYGSIENARKAAARDEMTVVVNYLKANGVVLPGTFANSGGAVAGAGTIS